MFEHFLLIRIIIHGIGFDIGFGGFFLIVRIAVFIRRQLLNQFDGTAFITRRLRDDIDMQVVKCRFRLHHK